MTPITGRKSLVGGDEEAASGGSFECSRAATAPPRSSISIAATVRVLKASRAQPPKRMSKQGEGGEEEMSGKQVASSNLIRVFPLSDQSTLLAHLFLTHSKFLQSNWLIYTVLCTGNEGVARGSAKGKEGGTEGRFKALRNECDAEAGGDGDDGVSRCGWDGKGVVE